jgi:uncharacterized protein YbbC (DUF1343 family)
MRHGLTIGELALMFNEYFSINCDLTVIPMKGWRRSMYFKDTGLPWIPPSPNLPTPSSAMVYPGQVLWEGTNISEGRGTTRPFELFGAPFINTEKILSELDLKSLPGTVLRQTVFEPSSNKWHGKQCNGFQLHITDPDKYRPYITTLKLLQAVISCNKNRFRWKLPPYEYEFEKLPIDLIIGNGKIRKQIENLNDIDEIAASWAHETDRFVRTSRQFYLYR